jgi:hypothetical protein
LGHTSKAIRFIRQRKKFACGWIFGTIEGESRRWITELSHRRTSEDGHRALLGDELLTECQWGCVGYHRRERLAEHNGRCHVTTRSAGGRAEADCDDHARSMTCSQGVPCRSTQLASRVSQTSAMFPACVVSNTSESFTGCEPASTRLSPKALKLASLIT